MADNAFLPILDSPVSNGKSWGRKTERKRDREKKEEKKRVAELENPRREIDSSRKNSCKFRRALRLWGGKKGNRGDKNEKEGGVVRGGGGWRWQKGRNASDGAWIKRERKLIEPRGNYELRWPRLIHFRFVQRFPRLAPTLLVTVHDGRAPDTRVFYPFPPMLRFRAVPLRFSLCRAFSTPSLACWGKPTESRGKGSEEEEKLPGNRVTGRGTPSTFTYEGGRVLKGVEGCGGKRGGENWEKRELRGYIH